MKQLTELFIRLNRMENTMDTILLSLPDCTDIALNELKVQAKKRYDRNQAETQAAREHEELTYRIQELEADYPRLRK